MDAKSEHISDSGSKEEESTNAAIVGNDVIDSEGNKCLEGEVEGEGKMFVEGEGKMSVEGEGKMSVEGEVEGEGKMSVEGEGKMSVEGEGKKCMDGEEVAPDCHSEAILARVDKQLLETLVSMGFSQIRAEKSLFLTQNAGVESAMGWIDDHEDDEDIDEPLMIVDGSQGEDGKPKLTPEEATAKAYELQKKIREERQKREKQEALESERKRMEGTKMALEMHRKLEEEERKKRVGNLRREKEEHDAHKEEQRQLIKRDWEERFGKPYEEPPVTEKVVKKSGKEQLIYWINCLKKYKTNDIERLRNCLGTLEAYCKNLHTSPTEPKFRRLNKENKAFVTRVACYPEAISVLRTVGFEDDSSGKFLEIQGQVDSFLLSQALKFMNVVQTQL